MEHLYWLDQINSSDLPRVGEKAFALSQLLQQGYPVIPGFVVPVLWWQNFLRLAGESEPLLADFPESFLYIDVDDAHHLQQFAQKIRQIFADLEFSDSWKSSLKTAISQLSSQVLIVRPAFILPSSQSSPVRGLYSSHLCWAQEQALEEALKDVWTQVFHARSIFYWYRHRTPLSQIQPVLLVQSCGDAIASGSVNVTPQFWNIQSTWGLGQSLVKGEVLPDFHQVDPATGQVQTQHLGNKLRVYHLNASPEVSENCLYPEILKEQQQESYALNESCLQNLIQLLQNLAPVVEDSYDLEWIWGHFSQGMEPQLFVTQLTRGAIPTELNKMELEVNAQTPSSPKILQGLGAATGKAVALTHLLTGSHQHTHKISGGRILVSHQITPDWLPLLKKAAGIITEIGGLTSHGAIMARELGIPAVVGVPQVTQHLKNGERISIDGDLGTIQAVPSEIDPPNAPIPDSRQHSSIMINSPLATQLLLNLNQSHSLENVLRLPVDGIGLMRGEWIILDLLSSSSFKGELKSNQQTLFVQKLQNILYRFASGFAPRAFSYRLSDHRILAQGNLSKVDFWEVELAALVQLQQQLSDTPIHLILPFIRSLEEFQSYRSQVEKTGLLEHNTCQLWIMAEVPSTLFLLPEYHQAGVQGIAIGTNDLISLLLGTDREQIAPPQLNALHPGVLNALKQLIKTAKALGIPCSICGHAPVESPQLIDYLVRWGITAISVEPEAVERTYQAIARAEHRLLIHAARRILDNEQ